MITLNKILKDKTNIDEDVLIDISEELWKMGNLSKIRKMVSPEVFTLHIGMNTIGNWQGEGWWGVISEQAELVPFIPNTLEAFGLLDLKEEFERVIEVFPTNTIFSNNEPTYHEVINFLQNTRFKVNDEKLNTISIEKRAEMVTCIHERLENLEAKTEPVWGYKAISEGWNNILEYISLHR